MANNALDIDEGRLREMIIEHNKGVTQKEAYKILQVVKDENKEKKLTKYQFFDEAKRVITHKLHKGNPYCTYCFKHFHSRKQMKEHVAVIHEKKEKSIMCEDCPSKFMSTKSLEYHKGMFHSETKEKVKCEVCDALFSHNISLLRHEKIHQEVKPTFECKVCHKTFQRKDSMTKHTKRVHGVLFSLSTHKIIEGVMSKRGILQCKMCHKDFLGPNAEDELETHIINRCQTFECKACKKPFGSKDSMKQHMIAHHSDKVELKCDKCYYKTKYKSNLKKHTKRQHPN